MKHCAGCGEDKPLDAFGSKGRSASGQAVKQKRCKPCVNQAARERDRRLRDSGVPRICARCKKTRPSTDFGRTYCRKCESKRRAAYESQSGEYRQAYARAYYLKKTYGITVEQYEAMLGAQGGGCAICEVAEGDSKGRRLFVDHNHVTGEIRMLLCARCNFAVKGLADDADWGRKVIEYVERYHLVA